jgi:rod shape determining protein RodA
MEQRRDSQRSYWASLDWFTILLYIALVVGGWFSICSATYNYGEMDFFSFSTTSGKQIVWIATAVVLAVGILSSNDRFYETFSNLIYWAFMVLLLVTIFIAPNTKGSHSWLNLGILKVQPAEFAKFGTVLMLAATMGKYGFDITKPLCFAKAVGIVLLPMALIVGEQETGSALVYTSFFLMFYREGMPGCILFTGVAAVVYFVVGVRFDGDMIGQTSTSLGECLVLMMIQLFSAGFVAVYTNKRNYLWNILGCVVVCNTLLLLFSEYVIPFDITWIQLSFVFALVIYLCYIFLRERVLSYYLIAVFALGSAAFYYSADMVLNQVMEPHQQVRIKVLLGLQDDLAGAGYNVNQSKIAIGSGGIEGKGFLNGTQTKLKYVPEQETDFIFCTVGEEQGFVGSSAVLLGFLILVLRLIHLAERQTQAFGRIYGYSLLSIFIFHVFINVGMVLGLTPVIGIPLPFFSYGGSSLWGFTILLFVFLRIDAGRGLKTSL